MADHTFIRIAVAILLLTGLCLGGLDQSGSNGAKNLTLSDFNALVPQDSLNIAVSDLGAPQTAAANAGTEVAAYTEQAPPAAMQKSLQPSAILTNPPRYMYYSGKYLSWSDFSVTFPSNQPGLWIERAVIWSTYATLPWGGWARELIYVPAASPVTMYEIYPDGYVIAYSLGFVQPGYYNIWYYADEPGRHRSMIATNSGYSNQLIIDVYGTIGTIITPKPTPDPQKECAARGWPWVWQDGKCQNMGPVPNPVAECEAKGWPWQWVNGECINVGPAPNPVAECEKNPLCHYVDGQCLCTGDVDTEKQNCEANPLCDYVNGQCYCRGEDTQPMPGPVPNPTPEPEPFNPAPNPVSQCGSGCYWSGSQCVCTGMLDTNSNSGGNDDTYSSGNLDATY